MNGLMVSLLAVLPLVPGVDVVPAPVAAAPVAASAETDTTGSEVYVSRKHCTVGADGGPGLPFCTISEAAAVAKPGQTVLVHPGDYPEAVSITRSGAESAPITFRAVNSPEGIVRVGNFTGMPAVAGNILSLVDVHDVVIDGFTLHAAAGRESVLVDKSDRVVMNAIAADRSQGVGDVRVTGGSNDVTISRSFFANMSGSAVIIDGARNAVVTGNQMVISGLLVVDAPGAVITNNTISTDCGYSIDVTGTSPGASIRNNVVRARRVSTGCATPTNATAISVSESSTAQTVIDYNLIAPMTAGPLYSWGGTDHWALESFAQATGQGAHEIIADPRLPAGPWGGRGGYPVAQASPAVDSGDPTAPGVTSTDMLGNPRSDNPAVNNTNGGYVDRGAIEAQGPITAGTYDLRRKPGAGPLDVIATAAPARVWPTSHTGGTFAYRFSNERFWRITTTPTADHSFRRAGSACVDIWANFDGFRSRAGFGRYSMCTIVGALYTPLPPTRLLDTRTAVGIATTTPVPPNSEIVLPVTRIGQVPVADISAVVLNVTVTRPTAAGFITVYPDGGPLPNASNVNFVARETVPNLVTVPMSNGSIRLRNSGSGTVHLIADLQGFYGREGSGLKTLTPTRVLDTRTGTAQPIPSNQDHRLDLSGKLPVDATAAILNITVTRPTSNGVLTVYPDGSPVPVASNLNFVTGQTIPNLVIVPVQNGRVAIRNASAGSTHIVADLMGYFGTAASGVVDHYVPYGPSRIADSRTGTGLVGRQQSGPLQKQEVAELSARYFEEFYNNGCNTNCPEPTALVANLTVTAPAAAGVLTAYPYRTSRPATSNVNFLPRETASNLAIVKTTETALLLHNGSSGTSHVIVDQTGYFISAAR